jgi:aryl-alcohol dehydrogenase-like predicted oxidoreductase
MTDRPNLISRRQAIKAGTAAGISLAIPGLAVAEPTASPCAEVICRKIPKTGEALPVIGVGTNRFGRTGLDTITGVLSSMHELGGRVIDTAALYGGSEEVIGHALSKLGLHDDFFVATKFNVAGAQFNGPPKAAGPDEISAADSFTRSLEWLQTDSVDLLFAHFVGSVEPLMPQMIDLKKKGKTRYIGITSVQRSQHPQVMEYMKKYPIDFLQIDYSLGNRDTANDVLPLAAELGIAVMVAVPFGGGRNSLFANVGDKTVPEWAADFGATTWGQLFLKYVIANPAVTCVIPGTTDVDHMADNQSAGRGSLPDESQLRRLESYWDGIS